MTDKQTNQMSGSIIQQGGAEEKTIILKKLIILK